jgi:histidinol dehydrogenase
MRLLKVEVLGTASFDALIARLGRRGETDLGKVEGPVREILEAVSSEGDPAVRRFVERFERRTVDRLLIHDYEGARALDEIEPQVAGAMREAADRIARYHERQKAFLGAFEYEENGIRLGARATPLERVGVYVPGGKASYPSSVLMSALIARVVGVSEIYVATPNASAAVRAACHLSGVTAILDAGGAQAIAALAYGTASVPRVDKIVGPGNLYVAAAKRLVFGQVDIDSIAGPSEILVLADETADPKIVAADLLSQAEHDEAAYPLLACTTEAIADAVDRELTEQLARLPRREIAEASIRGQGYAMVVRDTLGLASVANALAAEHLAVHTAGPSQVAAAVKRAGAIFIGAATPEAAGDYIAGPSHVLPTGGAARFAAPLGVYDFVSRTSLVCYELSALRAQAAQIKAFARSEGLEAHARAVDVREN